jgi:hypothetical protein
MVLHAGFLISSCNLNSGTEPEAEAENGELSFSISFSDVRDELVYTVNTIHVELINLSDPNDTRTDELDMVLIPE